jgi:glycosyltransferase involved in cell wall biosynthesis
MPAQTEPSTSIAPPSLYDRADGHIKHLAAIVSAAEKLFAQLGSSTGPEQDAAAARLLTTLVDGGIEQSKADQLFRLLEANPSLFRRHPRSSASGAWVLRREWVALIDRLAGVRQRFNDARKVAKAAPAPVAPAPVTAVTVRPAPAPDNTVARNWLGVMAEAAAHFIGLADAAGRRWTPAALVESPVSAPPADPVVIATIRDSGLFDEAHYRSQAQIASHKIVGPDLLTDYVEQGWRLGLDPNPLFSVDFYAARNPAVALAGHEPLSHYIIAGSAGGRDPHPLFNTAFYAAGAAEPTAARTWLGDFFAQGKQARATSPLFLADHYAAEVGSGPMPFAVALLSYLVEGWRHGHAFSPLFDPIHYWSQSKADEREPFLHYVLSGAQQGHTPNPLFDPGFYFRQNVAAREAALDPLSHYVLVGEGEGRKPSRLFDPRFYRRNCSMPLNGGALQHYLTVGFAADMAPIAGFDSAGYRKAFMPKHPAAERPAPIEHLVLEGLHGSPRDRAMALVEPTGEEVKTTPRRPVFDTLPSLDVPDDLAKRVTWRSYPGKLKYRPGRPNVLIIAHAASEHLFGSERSFLDMVDGLSHVDVNIVVVVPRNAPIYTNELRKKSHLVVAFSYGWWLKGKGTSEDAYNVYRAIIQQLGIVVVHANTIMLRECLTAARDLDVATIVHVRELITLDKTLTEVIGLPADEIIADVHKRADWIVANSQTTAKAFAKPGRTLVVPNTADIETLDIPNPLDADGLVRFGLISSNIPKKGLADVVALATLAEKTCPQARFLLIGPLTDAVKDIMARQEKGECPRNLLFPGYAASPREAIAQCHVVMSFSHFAESFGRTALEAMIAGRPVIAYEHGAIPELIRHGVNGFLVPFMQIERALPFVETLCAQPEKIALLGEFGRKLAREHFGLDQYRATFRKVYDVVLPEATAVPGHYVADTSAGPIVKAARRPGLKDLREQPRVAYFCWHFPVPSETFVLNEIEELLRVGVDVIVFCRQSPYKSFKPRFDVRFERVDSADKLAERLIETGRTVVHAHFTYPTVTDMVWPACEKAQLPFTFIAHAQDIFKYDNDRRNRLSEIGASPLCLKAFTLSTYHLEFMAARGFPRDKIVINPNAVDTTRFQAAAAPDREARRARRIVAVHRFVRKKGLDILIRAGDHLRDLDIRIDIYGYGELAPQYRELIDELKLTNVVIHGALAQDEVVDTLREADLFACPAIRVEEDGDMDGLPTSIVESMAAGVPVLTTAVGALPELVVDEITGIVAEPDPESVAASIRRFYAMPTEQVRSIIDAARERAVRVHDVQRLARVLMRVWENRLTDVIIVSWNNLEELRGVVERILQNTALPYHLIICDNQSSREPVPQFLDALWEREDRVTVIHNDSNAMVGPGTNAGLAQGTGDIAIYVCGREGFSFATGWEIPFIHAFAESPETGLTGTIGISPTYLTGKDYPTGIRLFPKFRNTDFAAKNPTRPFGHVQGGLFAMRRSMVDAIGGFSEAVPHDYTDVEYSYYAESMGWRLGETPGVLALFNKSRPTLSQRFDDTLVVAHPVLLPEVRTFDAVRAGLLSHCNLCNWFGPGLKEAERCCPNCGSRPADRSMFRYLGESPFLFRRLPALCIGFEGAFDDTLAKQFQGPRMPEATFVGELQAKGRLPNRAGGLHLGLLRLGDVEPAAIKAIGAELHRAMVPGATIMLQPGRTVTDSRAWRDAVLAPFAPAVREAHRTHRYSSRAVQYAYEPIIELQLTRAEAMAETG